MTTRNNDLQQATAIISGLTMSANLDANEQADDCLLCFDDIEWKRHPEADVGRFEALLEKGNDGDLSLGELTEFMRLVDPEGELHLYYWLTMSNDFLATHREAQEAA